MNHVHSDSLIALCLTAHEREIHKTSFFGSEIFVNTRYHNYTLRIDRFLFVFNVSPDRSSIRLLLNQQNLFCSVRLTMAAVPLT